MFTGKDVLLLVWLEFIVVVCWQQEQTTRKLKQETMAQLSAKQHKLDMLKNIINHDNDSSAINTRLRTAGLTA